MITHIHEHCLVLLLQHVGLEEQRIPSVFSYNAGGQRLVTDDQGDGGSVVVVDEHGGANGDMEVRRIILPGGHEIHDHQVQQQQEEEVEHKPQTITIQQASDGSVQDTATVETLLGNTVSGLPGVVTAMPGVVAGVPGQQNNTVMATVVGQSGDQQQPQSIEVVLPSGNHTFTVPVGGSQDCPGQETVQYQVECLSGDPLTEADFNAIRMLAQASLSGAHIVQQ